MMLNFVIDPGGDQSVHSSLRKSPWMQFIRWKGEVSHKFWPPDFTFSSFKLLLNQFLVGPLCLCQYVLICCWQLLMFYLVPKGQIPNSAPGVQGGTACRLFQDAELSPHSSSSPYSSSLLRRLSSFFFILVINRTSPHSYSYSSSLL